MMQAKPHSAILFSIFILLLVGKGFLDTFPLLYGEGLRWYGDGVDPGATYVTLGSVCLLLFGMYLVWVSCRRFNQIYADWKNNAFAYPKLLKSYGEAFLYSLYLFLISFVAAVYAVMAMGDDLPNLIRLLELDTLLYYLFTDFGIFFPISLFTLFLSIQSLIFANRHARSYRFGIILLIASIILLVLSIPALLLLGSFWIQGGGQFYI